MQSDSVLYLYNINGKYLAKTSARETLNHVIVTKVCPASGAQLADSEFQDAEHAVMGGTANHLLVYRLATYALAAAF